MKLEALSLAQLIILKPWHGVGSGTRTEITRRDTRQLGKEVVDKVGKEIVDRVDNDIWLDIFFVGLSVFVAGAQEGDYSLEHWTTRHQSL